jgi:hypothetical protein
MSSMVALSGSIQRSSEFDSQQQAEIFCLLKQEDILGDMASFSSEGLRRDSSGADEVHEVYTQDYIDNVYDFGYENLRYFNVGPVVYQVDFKEIDAYGFLVVDKQHYGYQDRYSFTALYHNGGMCFYDVLLKIVKENDI